MKLPSFIYVSICISLLSCQSNESKFENNASSETADITSTTGLTGDSVKLVKTASINCKVKDAHQGARAISQLAQKLGGMISHQNIESIQNQSKELPISTDSIMVITAYNTQADITARVPAQNLEAFIYEMTSIGYFTFNSRMDIDDKSLDYLAAALKQQNRNEVVNRTGNRNAKGLTDTQLIQTKDDAIDQQIANQRIDADVQYSTVQLNLYQNPIVRKEVIANYSTSKYEFPFNTRLHNAFSTGWNIFLNFLLVLVHLWPFIFLTIAVWMGYKYLWLSFTQLHRPKL